MNLLRAVEEEIAFIEVFLYTNVLADKDGFVNTTRY